MVSLLILILFYLFFIGFAHKFYNIDHQVSDDICLPNNTVSDGLAKLRENSYLHHFSGAFGSL